MLSAFLTLITSIFPFLKELILGNQTVRDALSHNKLMVFMGFLFLFMFGANLYMDDVDVYLKGQVDSLNKQLTALKSTPPLTCPKIDPKIVLSSPPEPVHPPTAPTQADLDAKDAIIKKLQEELHRKNSPKRAPPNSTTTTAPPHDPLDRLYN